MPNNNPKQRPDPAPLWNNVITMTGAFLVVVALLGLLTFGLFQLLGPVTNPYVDIVGYLVIPGILVAGLLIIPLGVLFKSWRLRRRDPEQRLAFGFPRVDLNDAAQRRAAKVVVGGTFILLPAVGVSSYHGYHYTDSVEFCAEACHSVMKPEAVTFARSGHARVPCAECHIGAGANWFVKSKLSGTRQVFATLLETYSRPIPPAIKHLRPARDTCEECHWPDKFFGAQLVKLTRFSSDEANTPQEVNMLLQTGGGSRLAGEHSGIHMHVALAGRIEYVAVDEKLQEIPWVKLTDDSGNEVIYRSDGRPHTDPKPEGQVRWMDCMDCHNRPAHKFMAPADAVDVALHEGTIDTSLPFIKREAVAALAHPYTDAESADSGIAAHLTEYYRTEHPRIWETHAESVHRAVETVKQLYHTNVFPSMNVDWRTYPDNIGHKTSPGCFRCHNGQHVAADGHKISHACSGCHTFLNLVEADDGSPVLREGEFIHAPELEGIHAELRCEQCHTGGTVPQPTCTGCHADVVNFRAGALPAFDWLDLPAEPMVDDVDCQDCHDLSQRAGVDTINPLCLDCHDDEEERFKTMLTSWKREVDQLLMNAEATVDPQRMDLLRALQEAGPLHNLEATRVIVRALTNRNSKPGDIKRISE